MFLIWVIFNLQNALTKYWADYFKSHQSRGKWGGQITVPSFLIVREGIWIVNWVIMAGSGIGFDGVHLFLVSECRRGFGHHSACSGPGSWGGVSASVRPMGRGGALGPGEVGGDAVGLLNSSCYKQRLVSRINPNLLLKIVLQTHEYYNLLS